MLIRATDAAIDAASVRYALDLGRERFVPAQ